MRHRLKTIQTGESTDYPILERWLREAATIIQGIRYYAAEYRPFQEMEVPAVSLLLGAAASAGYYPISEYDTRKRNLKDARRIDDGRGDLWFVAGTEAYAFEFKRAWNSSSVLQLDQCMELAVRDAHRIDSDEADHYFGGVLAPIFDPDDVLKYEDYQNADYVGVIENDIPELFLFLTKVTE